MNNEYDYQKIAPKKPFQARALENVINSALYHLSQRDLTESELRRKLANKTDNQQWIDETVKRCFELNYLKSDLDFSHKFAEQSFRNEYGGHYVKRKLAAKGISQRDIETALAEASTQNNIDECTLIRSRLLPYGDLSTIAREKLVNGLINRGFQRQTIENVLKAHPDYNNLKTKVQIKGRNLDLETELLKLAKKSKGLQAIKQQLRLKHVDLAELETLVKKLELSGEIDFFETALKALKAKNFDLSVYKDKAKAYAFLSNRGFNSEQIIYATNTLLEEADT